MSIREYKKDHLIEHAGIASTTLDMLEAPESGDPLIFWTRHETHSTQVNLHRFSTGQSAPKGLSHQSNFIAFTGRPKLILQLAPAIEDSLFGASPKTATGCINTLLAWWRILDSVEAAANQAGQPFVRVEDVRQLTAIHSEFAHRIKMTRVPFTTFRAIADTTRLALGTRPLNWQAPERPDPQSHQPPDELVKALRIELKRAWRNVYARWTQVEQLVACPVTPADPAEARLYSSARHMRAMQKKFGKALPTPDELRDGIPEGDFLEKTGLSLLAVRESAFPTRWDADAAFHLFLCNTGWNPSTLYALDAQKKFLVTHPKDTSDSPFKRFVLSAETYTLASDKARAGNKEQVIFGLWKTEAGPGHIIKEYLERVAPLRKQLEERLLEEKRRYAELVGTDDAYEKLATQFSKVQRLEQGCHSVWLYVDRFGDIVWLAPKQSEGHVIAGKKVPFVTAILHKLNKQRAERNEALIPHVTPSDFRDFFATYVWRASGGNILAVKRALGHAQLSTTAGYLNNNVLNKEADESARRFLNILAGELSGGRLDLTILTHLQRHGAVSPQMQERLTELRALNRSRLNVACKQPNRPPLKIHPQGQGLCTDHRCLMCPENAVLLPESYDGISMRVEEILTLQNHLPIETWINADFPLELQTNLLALRLFDKDLVLAARKKWADAISCGAHYVPGVPNPSKELEDA